MSQNFSYFEFENTVLLQSTRQSPVPKPVGFAESGRLSPVPWKVVESYMELLNMSIYNKSNIVNSGLE